MIRKLDKRQQRRLAIGILAGTIAIALLITAGPVWVANASRQATLDDAHERLQRYRQVSARDRELLPQYQRLLQQQRSAGNHLRSETSAVAGAELQRILKTITGRNQAQILSTQLLPVSEEQGFMRVALKVRLRGELPAILQSLYDIETDDVHMFVDNVALRDNMSGRSQYRGQLRPMDAEFELVAYMPEAS
jgi:general secretion pathway protein M